MPKFWQDFNVLRKKRKERAGKFKFPESALAHAYLDGLDGIEIGGSAHNAFGLKTRNVDYTTDMNTSFKRAEIEMCGEAMPVDIVAPGDDLPFEDESVDFVLSSHVIEHFFDPIRALEEWLRVARKWVFIICPQRDALPSDVDQPLTPLDELLARHSGEIAPQVHDTDEHLTRWTSAGFVAMCEARGWVVDFVQDPDDKVGNGFTVVIDASKTRARRR